MGPVQLQLESFWARSNRMRVDPSLCFLVDPVTNFGKRLSRLQQPLFDLCAIHALDEGEQIVANPISIELGIHIAPIDTILLVQCGQVIEDILSRKMKHGPSQDDFIAVSNRPKGFHPRET